MWDFQEKEEKLTAKVSQLYEENVDWSEKSKMIYKEVRSGQLLQEKERYQMMAKIKDQ